MNQDFKNCLDRGTIYPDPSVKNLEMQYIRNLLNAMSLREDADYADEYSKQGAQDSLITAKEFIQKAQELLNKVV